MAIDVAKKVADYIVYVGGCKGGVGKSLVAMLTLNYFLSRAQKCLLIDTDTSNSNVLWSYEKSCASYAYDIDSEKGWRDVLTLINKNGGKCPVVMNSGARNQAGIRLFGKTLNKLPNVVTLWPIDPFRDSLVLLNDFLKTVDRTRICIIKNAGAVGYEEKDFSLLESKPALAALPSVYLPRVPECVTQRLYNERMPIHEVLGKLDFADRLLSEDWFQVAAEPIAKALEVAAVPEFSKPAKE